jgi:hypothetical protein
MTPEEREKMNELCRRIQDEKDPKLFDELVQQLLQILEAKHERINPGHKTKRN